MNTLTWLKRSESAVVGSTFRIYLRGKAEKHPNKIDYNLDGTVISAEFIHGVEALSFATVIELAWDVDVNKTVMLVDNVESIKLYRKRKDINRFMFLPLSQIIKMELKESKTFVFTP